LAFQNLLISVSVSLHLIPPCRLLDTASATKGLYSGLYFANHRGLLNLKEEFMNIFF